MNRAEVKAILPYGEEFLFIDEAHHKGPRELSASFSWQMQNPLLRAHFASGPHVVPAVLLAEQSLQAALLLAILAGHSDPGRPMLIGQFRCDTVRPVTVPSTTITSVTIEAIIDRKVAFRCACVCGSDDVVSRVRGIAVPVPYGAQ